MSSSRGGYPSEIILLALVVFQDGLIGLGKAKEGIGDKQYSNLYISCSGFSNG